MRSRSQSGAGAMALALLATVFGVTLFLSVSVGALVYRNVSDRSQSNARERVGLSYITSRIHSFDEAGFMDVGSFGGNDAVFLYEDHDGKRYETIIYVYNGWLRELRCDSGEEAGQEPEFGTGIVEAERLEVSKPEEGLLHLTYTVREGESGREADIYLRSGYGQ